MRTVPEWTGRTDNSMPPKSVKLRIIERQGNRCALTGREFQAGDQIHFDHATPLWLGGKNAEGNLQAVISEAHVRKTQAEATVRAKINRVRAKHLGLAKSKSHLPGNRNSKWKKKINGEVVLR